MDLLLTQLTNIYQLLLSSKAPDTAKVAQLLAEQILIVSQLKDQYRKILETLSFRVQVIEKKFNQI